MTSEAYANLLEYIAQNNCWGINMYGITVERKRKAIKYVEASFDSRDRTIEPRRQIQFMRLSKNFMVIVLQ